MEERAVLKTGCWEGRFRVFVGEGSRAGKQGAWDKGGWVDLVGAGRL